MKHDINTQKQIDLRVEQLDAFEEDVNSGVISDAVRMGYMQTAMSILRWFKRTGYEYDGTGSFITAARDKIGFPHPTPAGEVRVADAQAQDAALSAEVGGESDLTGTEGSAFTPSSPSTQEQVAEVAAEAVQAGREADSDSDEVLRGGPQEV